MKHNNVLNFIGFESNYEDSEIVLFGAPYDGTTSFRPGTRLAPNVMRIDSYGLETYSPFLDLDMTDYDLCDSGDLDFPFGNVKRVLDMIKDHTDKIVNDGKVPFMIGGEHLVSLPAINSVFNKYPELRVIHLDAHADLRADYMGEPLSHASVIRRSWDFLGDNKIFQFGIRSGEKTEFDFAKEHTYMNKFDLNTLDKIVEDIKGHPVYITIDLDVLDPSIFAGTGTPEPGGITYKEMQGAMELFTKLNVVGADVVELAPQYDASGVSNAVACKVVRELALAIMKNR